VLGSARVVLDSKEGLALTNGCTFTLALATLAVADMRRLLSDATKAMALMFEATRAVRDPFLQQLHALRPYPGALRFSAEILRLLEGSQLADGDASENPKRMPPQDPYSIRCTPAAFAAFYDALEYTERAVAIELNSVTDNPLFIDLPRSYPVVSGGHFHGDPLAIPLDTLKIAATKLGSLAERQIFKLTDFESRGVPPMLLGVPKEKWGLNSGFMILQYTAAAVVNECSTLAHPSSVHSIPSSANQEDYVSMSMNAARHTRTVIANAEKIVAMLFLSAAQAIDAQAIPVEKMADGTRAVFYAVRRVVPALKEDRAMWPDVEAVIGLMRAGL
jgi:histidine ammonia-lyase